MIKYIDKKNTYIDDSVEIGEETIIYPNVVLEGNTIIGKNCIIHLGCYIKDSIIGDNTVIYQSQIEESQIGKHCIIGPFAHIRPNNIIKNNVKVGSFVELKNNSIGDSTKIPHLSYVGDATIGKKVNISCGVITANFNGKKKQETIIEDNTFIGCNTNLIAPILIRQNSIVAPGVTIVEDIEADTQVIYKNGKLIKKNNREIV